MAIYVHANTVVTTYTVDVKLAACELIGKELIFRVPRVRLRRY